MGPRAHEFVFARLRYDSGDWDYNPKVAANVLDAVVQYTTIPVYRQEIVITADSDGAVGVSVRVHDRPQAGPLQRRRARESGAVRRGRRRCSSPTTATTTSTGSTRSRSKTRCAARFRDRRRSPRFRTRTGSIDRSSRSLTDRRKPATSSTAGATTWFTTTSAASSARPAGRDLLEQGLRLRVGLRLAQQAVSR